LRATIEAALSKEPSLADDVARRIVNRVLRQASQIAEIGVALRAAEQEKQAAVEAQAQPRAFDPYEIGAVVTLQRLGADGLLSRLSGIGSVEELRSLAVAQNLSIKTDWSNADELRVAIVQGAEQRLADRRAAAS
jgi:hypothetical protein